MTRRFDQLSTPKHSPHVRGQAPALYKYYAGYSLGFVRDVIEHFELGDDDGILDPWNGAGTTTQAASELGVRSWGSDANPAMVVVAKARLLGRQVTPSELSLCEAIVETAFASEALKLEDEPLRVWFGPAAAKLLRALERAIGQLLDPNYAGGPPATPDRVTSLSPLAAFFYVALFRATRELITPFVASNPTWIKRPASQRERLRPGQATIAMLFRRHVRSMSLSIESGQKARCAQADDLIRAEVHSHTGVDSANQLGYSQTRTTIAVADSTALPLKENSIAAVVSSPPYCTRIDYAVATAPELAVLGVSESQFNAIRSGMIGTSKVTNGNIDLDFGWGATCADLLDAVASHSSKASSGYYLRNHLQYFAGLAASLKEMDRVLRPASPCVLVVQDSFYKDVHIDLPAIVSEMGEALGWKPQARRDYRSSHNMARVNAKTRRYRQPLFATESAILFRTASGA